MRSTDDALVHAFFGPPSLEFIKEAIWAARLTRYVNYAVITIMMWDMILTFSREVNLIWNGRFGLLKVIFLFNRYVTPVVLGVDIWTMTGRAKGLSSDFCRNWFSVAYLIQLICGASVSLIIALRLWAWYQMSTRTLYLLLFIWFASFVGTTALVVVSIWLNRSNMVYISSFNICMSLQPVIWTQWLPWSLEHGIYLVFLILNAMSTPRSARSTALAILYREGIIFYALTFCVMLASLMIWRFTNRVYSGLGMYASWVVLQIAISRILLDVRNSELFQRKVTGADDGHGSLNLTSSRHHRGRSRTPTSGDQLYTSSVSSQSHATSYPLKERKERRLQVEEGPSTRPSAEPTFQRIWWLSPRWRVHSSKNAELYVDVVYDNDAHESPGVIGPQEGLGGLKVSRLGRYDEWL